MFIHSNCLTLLCLVLTSSPAAYAVDSTPTKVELVLGHWLAEESLAEKDAPVVATPSPLQHPFGVDFDQQGNMFVVELEGGRVHQVDPNGQLRTIAGDGSKGYQGDGGPAHKATFNGIHNVAVSPTGDIYIADSWNHCIRKIEKKSGVISTFAGTGEPGFSGDGGPATEAQFNYVMCIALNPAGDKLYLADLRNRRIRWIDLQSSLVASLAGNGQKGVPQDGSRAVDSPLVDPRAVAVDPAGNVYILERNGHALRVVDRDGTLRTVAGSGIAGSADGAARQAQFNSPKHLCIDDRERVFIADDKNQAVRRYDPKSKRLTTVLGHGRGSPQVRLKNPHGVCYERGYLYVVDSGNNRVLRIAQ